VFERVAAHLEARGHRVRIVSSPTFPLRRRLLFWQKLPLRDSLAVLRNDRTGHFYVMDCHDWPTTFDLPDITRDPRCQVVLRCQYRPGAHGGPRAEVVRPWTYFDAPWPTLQPRLPELRARPRTEPRLYFRGLLWKEREGIVRELQRRGLLDDDVAHVPFEQYLDEASRHCVMLSLSGMGDFCHRDMEGFAIGTPVLRPRPVNRFHDPIEGGRHFISVDTHIDEDWPEVVAAKIERSFREVVGDGALLGRVAAEAAAWYDRNVAVPSSIELTASLLGFGG
jgi:hypothetical protein